MGREALTQLTNAPRNWWHAKEGHVSTAVMSYVRTVENFQAELFDKFAKLESSYDTNPRTNRYSAGQNMPGRSGRARSIVTQNLVATNIDTVASQVADTDIRIRVQTDGADWSHQRRAKALESYANGMMILLDVMAKCRRGFNSGAGLKGSGKNKVWIDQFDRPRVTPVPIDNIVVDEIECRDGEPRQLHYRDFFDREDLMAQYPEHAEKIATAQAAGGWRLWAGYRPMQPNEVVCIESWRLPIGPKGHKNYVPGRHTIVVDGCDLLDEQYHDSFFPFPRMVWNAPSWGYYGISLAERIIPHQNLLNRRNYQINRSLDLKADPITYVNQADQHLAVKTVNQIGSIAVYKTAIPQTVDHQAVGAETYQSADKIPRDAAMEAGVGEGMQSGGVPAGIESGVGVREVRTTRVQRFSIQEKAFERFVLDTVWHILDCCKKLGADAPDILHVTSFGSRKIKWSEVDMGDLKIQLAAASTLGDSPAGRQQRVVELAQAGVITMDESRQLMDHPDIASKLSMYNAMLESAENAIERILDGESLTPTPYMNLDVCVKLAQRTYLKIDVGEKNGGAPEDVLERLSDFIAVAAAILNPPQVPGAPTDQSMMPMEPGAAAPPDSIPMGGPSEQVGAGAGAYAPGAFAPMQA